MLLMFKNRQIRKYRIKGTLRIFVTVTVIICWIIGSGISQKAFAQNWYNSAWAYRKAITINSDMVSGTQTDFPVLVSLTSDAGLSAHALASGNDILFTSGDGITKIPYQREYYSNGTLAAWVNCPIVTTGTVLYIYYGNPMAVDQQTASSVWDANYKLVYHLGENGPTYVYDATSNNNTGAQSGGVTFSAAGKIGNATAYANGGITPNQYISVGTSPGVGGTSSFTYEVWVKVSSFNNNTSMTSADGSYFIDRTTGTTPLVSLIPCGNKFGFQMRYDDGSGLGGPNGGPNISLSTWYHVAMVRDYGNNLFRLYVNGIQQATTLSNSALSLTPPIPKLGRHATFSGSGVVTFLNGSIDEFRISGIARSPEWISAEYNNQNSSSTFYTVSAEVNQPEVTTMSDVDICPGASTILNAPGGMSAYYPFNGNVNDYSGNGLHLSGSGGTFTGGGIQLSNTSAYTSISTSVLNTDKYTISFDMKYTSVSDGNWRKIFGYAPAGTDRSPGIWKYPTSMQLHWRHDPGNTGLGEAYSYTLNQWYHIVGEKNGSTFTLYVDGVQVDQGTIANPKTAGLAGLWFGGANVILKEFKIYSGDLRWYTGNCGGAPAGSGTTINVTPTATTTYYVRSERISNNTACASTTVNVHVITFSVTPENITCFNAVNGQITISNVSGGTPPYQYSIYNGNTGTYQTSNTFTGLSAGTYKIRVKDNIGCESPVCQ
jgi:hypothetical protein